MARPREFDEAEVIERAMNRFWSHGYEATSVDDLCAATGLNRSSLYRSFGSKRELLDIALSTYEKRSLAKIRDVLAERPIKEGLRLFLMGAFHEDSSGRASWGCLIGNCAGELAERDPQARQRLRQSLFRIEAIIREALETAQRDGELTTRTDPQSLAQFIMTQAQGLRLVAKTRPTRDILENIVATTLSILD